MILTKLDENVPMYIQIQGPKMNDYLQRKLCGIATTLKELSDEIVRIDVRLKESAHQVVSPRTITVTVNYAGAELRASDSGKHWKLLVKHVQERLKRQIEQRKELLKRQSILRVPASAAI